MILQPLLAYGRFTAQRMRLRLQGKASFLQQTLAIQGELTANEATLLFDCAKHTTEGVIVEIGSNYGRSTVALACGSQAGANVAVFAVEPHEHFVGVLGGTFGPENRAGFYRSMLHTGSYRTVRLLNTSSEILAPGWQQPIGFLWIDGDHRYDAVWRDVRAWLPHLLPYARIAFHDSVNPDLGPHRVIKELLAAGEFGHVKTIDTITLIERQG